MAQKSDEEVIADAKPEDVTWLSDKVVMFNKRNISNDPTSLVFEGRRKFFGNKYKEVAIKLISNTLKNREQISILAKLNHDNIVHIEEVGSHHGAGDWIYIVMPRCTMTLDEYIAEGKVDSRKAYKFFNQLVAAVMRLHENNVAHRNLKPANILVSQSGNFIRISDFAISEEISTSSSISQVPAMDGFKAPEVLAGETEVLLSSDIFALGLIAAFLFSNGKHPFGSKPYEQVNKIMTRRTPNLSRTIPLSATPKRQQLLRLIEWMLRQEPTDRPTALEIHRHAFFST